MCGVFTKDSIEICLYFTNIPSVGSVYKTKIEQKQISRGIYVYTLDFFLVNRANCDAHYMVRTVDQLKLIWTQIWTKLI